jgi:hypothetical protein
VASDEALDAYLPPLSTTLKNRVLQADGIP